uniref:ABC transmembrane type-1 domain-containing protein n=1 Tax=Polytomella parva TaxID=51329 RepID=A0A7S0V4D2_9CHLO
MQSLNLVPQSHLYQHNVNRNSASSILSIPLLKRPQSLCKSSVLRNKAFFHNTKNNILSPQRQNVSFFKSPVDFKVRRPRHVVEAGPAGGLGGHSASAGEPVDTPVKRTILTVAVAYIFLVVLIPFFNVFIQAFAKGVGAFLHHFLDPDFLHALKMTLLLAFVTVPINTVFGTMAAVNITRNEFPGKVLLMSLLDLPFSISPVVTGLMLNLLYGRTGWFAAFLKATGINVVFAFTGMALATMFVTLPFVVREVIPVLETMDLSQEEAARTLGANDWQVFWTVTLPNIRWALLYGIILCNARAMGEFGAVSVISGNILGKTQTLTLFVESAYKEYATEAAFAAAVLLSFLAIGTLWVKGKVEEAAAAETRK